MEIADIFVVNKSDREGAGILKGNISKMLAHRPGNDRDVPVLNTIATTSEGVEALYESIIKHGTSSAGNQKKIFLLTEKAFQLIRNRKMKGIKKDKLKSQLEDVVKEKDFNLYRFVESYSG